MFCDNHTKTSTQVHLHAPKRKKIEKKCLSSVFCVTIACSGDHEEEEDRYFIDLSDKYREQEEEEEAPATTAAKHNSFLHR